MTNPKIWKLELFLVFLLLLNFSSQNLAKAPREASAVQLIKMCEFNVSLPSGHVSACPENTLNIVLDEDCNGNIIQRLFVANLEDFPVHGQSYPLPTEVPDIYIRYSIDGGSEHITGPYTSFLYDTSLQVVPKPIFMAENLIPVSNDFGDCRNEQGYDLQDLLVEVVKRETQTTYVIYPIHDYSDSDEIYSCYVFEETCNDCSGNPGCDPNAPDDPIYEEELCIECGACEAGTFSEDTPANTFQAQISPNPFQNQAILEIANPKAGYANLGIFDAHGQLIRETSLAMEKGRFRHAVDTGDLPPGVYYFRVTTGKNVETMKMVKLRNESIGW